MWSLAEAITVYDALREASRAILRALGCRENLVERRRPWISDGPSGVAYHWTGGAALEKSIKWFNHPEWNNAVSSAHVIIGDAVCDDAIGNAWTQLDPDILRYFPVPAIILADWNQGVWCTNWANGHCLGVEMRNRGPATDAARSITIGRGTYERYTREQLIAAIHIGRLARCLHRDHMAQDWIVGHHMIWARKRDPGPDFPLHLVRHAIFDDTSIAELAWLSGWPQADPAAPVEDVWSPDYQRRETIIAPVTVYARTMAWVADESRHADEVSSYLYRLGWPLPSTPERIRLRHFVRQFQRSTLGYVNPEQHLMVDGLAGPKTRAALVKRLEELDL